MFRAFMPIFRRTNCILTASGIVALCKQRHSTPVKSGLTESALNLCTVQLFTESDNTRCCENTICPPEDGREYSKHVEDSSVTYILLLNKELCIKVGKWNNSILWCTVEKTSASVSQHFAWILVISLKLLPFYPIFCFWKRKSHTCCMWRGGRVWSDGYFV